MLRIPDITRKSYIEPAGGLPAYRFQEAVVYVNYYSIQVTPVAPAEYLDDDFPTVEIGSRVADIIWRDQSEETTLQCLREMFTTSILALREMNWLALAQTISDWTATAETLSDPELTRRLLED